MYPSGFESNLQRKAMLCIGRSIWRHPKVLAEIKSWNDRFFFWPYNPVSDWHKFVRNILKQIRQQTSLPEHLQCELLDLVKAMGFELLDFLEYVKLMNKDYYRLLCRTYWEHIDCPSSIHWTNHGTIDFRKTIEESWVKNPDPKKLCATYHMAIRAGVEESRVHAIWNSMSDLQRDVYGGLLDEEYAVNVYYESHREKKLHQLREDLENGRGSYRMPVSYDRHLSFDENMFLVFVSEGYPEAAKLLWERLDELARERVLEKGAEMALESWRNPVRNYDDYMSRQWADLSVFLMSQLTREQKMMFLGNKASDILRMVAITWPWRDFFMQVFEELWGYFGNDGNYDWLLFDIADRLVKEDAQGGYVVEGSKSQQLFQKCWRRLPSEAKLECGRRLIMTVPILIEARDLSSAQMILNSPEVVDKKPVMLRLSRHLFEEMVEKNEFSALEKFIEGSFKTDREKKAFKQSLMPHTKFILRSRFDLADKCLDWQCKTEREKHAIKMAIDYNKIWYTNSYTRSLVARQFLNWQCSSFEKRRSTKNGLACEFGRDTIYKLWIRWKANVRKGEKKAVDFFEWFVKLEVNIAVFRVTKCLIDNLIMLLVEAIINQNYFDILDHFKCWCSLTEQEVKQVRQKILNSTKTPICRHYIEAGEIHVSRGFLQWFEDEKEKKSFINHFVSNKGSTSCYLFIANERSIASKKKSKFRDFIDCWIRPLEKAQLSQFKRGVGFQAKKSKYKQPKEFQNYEIFQTLLNELT